MIMAQDYRHSVLLPSKLIKEPMPTQDLASLKNALLTQLGLDQR